MSPEKLTKKNTGEGPTVEELKAQAAALEKELKERTADKEAEIKRLEDDPEADLGGLVRVPAPPRPTDEPKAEVIEGEPVSEEEYERIKSATDARTAASTTPPHDTNPTEEKPPSPGKEKKKGRKRKEKKDRNVKTETVTPEVNLEGLSSGAIELLRQAAVEELEEVTTAKASASASVGSLGENDARKILGAIATGPLAHFRVAFQTSGSSEARRVLDAVEAVYAKYRGPIERAKAREKAARTPVEPKPAAETEAPRGDEAAAAEIDTTLEHPRRTIAEARAIIEETTERMKEVRRAQERKNSEDSSPLRVEISNLENRLGEIQRIIEDLTAREHELAEEAERDFSGANTVEKLQAELIKVMTKTFIRKATREEKLLRIQRAIDERKYPTKHRILRRMSRGNRAVLFGPAVNPEHPTVEEINRVMRGRTEEQNMSGEELTFQGYTDLGGRNGAIMATSNGYYVAINNMDDLPRDGDNAIILDHHDARYQLIDPSGNVIFGITGNLQEAHQRMVTDAGEYQNQLINTGNVDDLMIEEAQIQRELYSTREKLDSIVARMTYIRFGDAETIDIDGERWNSGLNEDREENPFRYHLIRQMGPGCLFVLFGKTGVEGLTLDRIQGIMGTEGEEDGVQPPVKYFDENILGEEDKDLDGKQVVRASSNGFYVTHDRDTGVYKIFTPYDQQAGIRSLAVREEEFKRMCDNYQRDQYNLFEDSQDDEAKARITEIQSARAELRDREQAVRDTEGEIRKTEMRNDNPFRYHLIRKMGPKSLYILFGVENIEDLTLERIHGVFREDEKRVDGIPLIDYQDYNREEDERDLDGNIVRTVAFNGFYVIENERTGRFQIINPESGNSEGGYVDLQNANDHLETLCNAYQRRQHGLFTEEQEN